MTVEERVPNERLRHARSLRGWSQAKLAEEVGTSFEMVSRWERGVTIPTLYFRGRLCDVLGMTAEELGLVHDVSDVLAMPTSQFVFLACSYADSEKVVVTRLKTVLQSRGVTLLGSRHIGRQGLEQPRKALGAAIRATQLILLIVSPEARSSRHVREALEIGRMYQRPICAVWIEGMNWQECLPSNEQEVPMTIDARMSDDAVLFEEVVTLVQQMLSESETSNASTPEVSQEQVPAGEPRNPYKGLQAFRQEDQHDFFGRDALIDKLTCTLASTLQTEQPGKPGARLLTIIGPSGSGKSSVMMAGLLPRLRQGGIAGSEAWIYLESMVPGAHPLESLALALAERLPERSLHTIRQDLEADSARGLHQLTMAMTHHLVTRVLLCVDQFEELFTQTSAQEERDQFLELLVTALSEPRGPMIVVLTLRADFYDRPMQYPDLFELIEDHHSFVLPMSLKELREVIEKPAELPDVQLTFEDDLVSDLLFEVQEQAGALPLLQFTLDQLFQKRNGHQLTIEAYEEIDGVKGAVAKHAEITYNSLPSEEHRKLARGLFLRLIDPGMTAQDTTRRRIPRSKLVLSNPKETAILEEVTNIFITARLLTTSTVSGIITVEVSHEAVIREWKRLSNWLEEAREDIILLQMIQEDAAEWNRHEHSVDRLYRGSQLVEALTCRERSLLSMDEEAFLQASTTEQARQEALLAERQQQEVWQRKHYTRRTVLVGLAGLGLAGGAVTATRLLLSATVSLPSLPPISLPYIYQGHTDAVYDVAWSPDGKRLASVSQDKTVRVWDASSGQTLLTYRGHTNVVIGVAWSPDGLYISSASVDKTVRIWDGSLGRTLLTFTGPTKVVESVAWSPDGKRLASSSWDKTVRVWDRSSGQTLLTYRGHTDIVTSVAWSSYNYHLASSSWDGSVREWLFL